MKCFHLWRRVGEVDCTKNHGVMHEIPEQHLSQSGDYVHGELPGPARTSPITVGK